MPCYETNLISVELVAADKGLLMEALKKVGLNPQYNKAYDVIYAGGFTFANDQVSAPAGSQAKINAIKQQYSYEVVNAKAKATGWTTSWDTSVNTNKVTATVTKW